MTALEKAELALHRTGYVMDTGAACPPDFRPWPRDLGPLVTHPQSAGHRRCGGHRRGARVRPRRRPQTEDTGHGVPSRRRVAAGDHHGRGTGCADHSGIDLRLAKGRAVWREKPHQQPPSPVWNAHSTLRHKSARAPRHDVSRILSRLGNPARRYSLNVTPMSAIRPRPAMKPAMIPAIEYGMVPKSAFSALISWRC